MLKKYDEPPLDKNHYINLPNVSLKVNKSNEKILCEIICKIIAKKILG